MCIDNKSHVLSLLWPIVKIFLFRYRFGYMGGTSQDVKRLKKLGFLASILWVFLTIYIVFVLMKINMCFKHLEASHIMSFDI